MTLAALPKTLSLNPNCNVYLFYCKSCQGTKKKSNFNHLEMQSPFPWGWRCTAFFSFKDSFCEGTPTPSLEGCAYPVKLGCLTQLLLGVAFSTTMVKSFFGWHIWGIYGEIYASIIFSTHTQVSLAVAQCPAQTHSRCLRVQGQNLYCSMRLSETFKLSSRTNLHGGANACYFKCHDRRPQHTLSKLLVGQKCWIRFKNLKVSKSKSCQITLFM